MAATKMEAQAGSSLSREIVVEAPQERAFRVFTESFDSWWPREHHIGQSAMKQAVLEGRQGGGWYELGEDGSRCQWGTVLVWDLTYYNDRLRREREYRTSHSAEP